jgi:hypothetical protein
MTIRSAYHLAFWLISCGVAGSAAAESETIYRLDVIVFTHLSGEPDSRHAGEIADFGDYLDPAAHARAAAWTRPPRSADLTAEEQARQDALVTMDQLRALEGPQPGREGAFRGGPTFPLQWQASPAMSPDMADAWERLMASPRHEALVWRSWYESLGGGERGRWIRLRGGGLLDLDWLTQETADDNYLEDFRPGPYPFLLPRARHALDGILRLRQRQFLHVDIDLVWQLPVAAAPFPHTEPWNRPEGFLAHQLEQSRTVRPDRVEYFDSGWLGVLVRVEEWRSPVAAMHDDPTDS